MSTLDHAFIRAYTADAEPRSAGAADQPVQQDAAAQASASRWRTKPGATRPGTVVPPPHISMAAFGNSAGGAAFSHSTTTIESFQTLNVSAAIMEASADSRAGEPAAWNRFDPPAVTANAAALAEAATESADNPTPRAAYEVDHFAWPELCGTLSSRLAPQFDDLAQQLLAESALGRKAIALAGACRGEGRTTLALVLAQRLADAGAKVLLVDADFDSPQLAARLGLGVAGGWQQALENGEPAWEAMIESLDDHLALLPLAPRSENMQKAAAAQTAAEFTNQHASAIRQHLGDLRQHFDVILVDAGPEASVHVANSRPLQGAIGGVDAAILVSDTRIAASSTLADLHRRLEDAHVVPLGVAETFCKADAA